MEAPGFWDDPERSNQKMKELKNLKDTVGECDKLSTQYDDILTLIDMGYEENDASLIPEIREELDEFIREFDELRIGTLLSGEYDKNNAILKLNAGAGGTESCDWCGMLYRMYSRWAEKKGFALEVLEHINQKISEYKEEDGNLYAIYGTPAENLCGLQVKQFRKKYGIIEGVSDREYVSNSFHCHVSEDITPIQKQDLENRFWDLSNGGKIQYVKYPIDYNTEAIKTLIHRAMDMGFYEGVNLSLAYCDDCGHQELEMDVCPKCGSRNLTKIDRMNGYLSYSRVHGDTRLNDAKMAEIAERKSM